MHELFENTLPRRDFLKMGAVMAGSTLALGGLAQAEPVKLAKKDSSQKSYKNLPGKMTVADRQTVEKLMPKDYAYLIGQVDGLSEAQLRAHFKLYENYVNKTNLLHELIAQADEQMLKDANSTYSSYREMHVEQSFAHNGVVLHELYFGNMGPKGPPSSELKAMVNRSFGSWDNYLKHLMATGKAMRGWAVTVFDMRDGQLRNFGLDLHNQWSAMHVYPVLVLDVYEHAYMIDYGTDRAKYLDVFVKNINWEAVDNRLIYAVHHLVSGPASTN